jgi:hypothetical protein
MILVPAAPLVWVDILNKKIHPAATLLPDGTIKILADWFDIKLVYEELDPVKGN